MFIGHYGLGLVIKRKRPELPLWVLFLAVQLVDIAWTLLVLAGVERVVVDPGFTAATPLRFEHYPYTHSLLAGVVWASAAGLAYAFFGGQPRRRRAGLAVAVAVLSHWFLDLPMHVADLPLMNDSIKVGFGLWNYPVLSLSLEILMLAGGMAWYLRGTRPTGKTGIWLPWGLAALLLVLQLGAYFGPPPPNVTGMAASGFVGFLLITALAAWLDRRRTQAR